MVALLIKIIYDRDQLKSRIQSMSQNQPTIVHTHGIRERNKAEKLARIIKAAHQQFREKGFEQTTGRQICEQAGIGTGTLFLYVKDKRELLSLIFQPLAERAFNGLSRGLGENESLLDGLDRVFTTFFDLYAEDPRMSRFFIQDLLFRSNDDPNLKQLSDALQERIIEMLSDARDQGDLRTDSSLDNLSMSFLAHYVFWLQLWLGSSSINRQSAMAGLRTALETQIDGTKQNRMV